MRQVSPFGDVRLSLFGGLLRRSVCWSVTRTGAVGRFVGPWLLRTWSGSYVEDRWARAILGWVRFAFDVLTRLP